MSMKEIGGYLELDNYNLPMLHDDAIALNSARNCLALLIRKKQIKQIYVPKFLCKSVSDICLKENVEVVYYSIGVDFLPIELQLPKKSWIYIVNYYGQLSNCVLSQLRKKYENIIIDNVQAFFQEPIKDIDTIYTCRKFFGVSDGAFLYSDISLDEPLDTDESLTRLAYLFGRYEKSASDFYSEYLKQEKLIASMPVRRMSKLTNNLLHGIDYQFAKDRRTQNFKYLYERLGKINKLKIKLIKGAYMYPLYIKNGDKIRAKMHREKIYIATLWPDTFLICKEDELEYDMAKNILPIPVDQRYTVSDMEYIVKKIKEITETLS